MRNPIRVLYKVLRSEIMIKGGLQPRGVYVLSKGGIVHDRAPSQRLAVPNIVGSFHQVLRSYWDHYGLGEKCLLASESVKVATTMHGYYPTTEFRSFDLFSELMGRDKEDRPDFVWDVCSTPPPELASELFHSVICHALLEHVIAPTNAIQNMLSLLGEGGRLYFMTHTPSYHKHQYPRDYVRFHHDYFEDLPRYLSTNCGMHVELDELHSTEGVVCGVFTQTKMKKCRADALKA